MTYRKLMGIALAGALIAGLAGCSRKNPGLETRIEDAAPFTAEINGNEYRFEGNRVTELASDEDNEAIYGIISDAHGEAEKAGAMAAEFKKRNADGIILAGDLAESFGGIKHVLEAVAETGLPVFVIPGNHERKGDYERAISEATKEHNNIIDMVRYRIFDGNDADFVSLPGYQTLRAAGRQFVPNDGYWANPEIIRETGKLAKGLDDSIVLITHGAGKTNAGLSPATIYNGADVGDDLTAKVQMEAGIMFAVCGHIHEAGGIAAGFDGTNVNQGEWAGQFTANFGTLKSWRNLDGKTYNGMAGIITIKGKQAKYEMIVLQ